MRVKLRKVGNSLTVTIPYEVAEELSLTEGTELNVLVQEDSVVFSPPGSILERIQARVAEELGDQPIPTDEEVVRWVEEMRYGRALDE